MEFLPETTSRFENHEVSWRELLEQLADSALINISTHGNGRL